MRWSAARAVHSAFAVAVWSATCSGEEPAPARPRVQEVRGVEKTPVLFVHGHGLAAQSWKRMIEFLEEQGGYPPQLLRAINLVPNDGPNRRAAEQIARAVEGLLRDVNAFLEARRRSGPAKTKVDLVSHSMGALSARWYTARIAPERVHTWVTLAGANHGTNALCSFVRRGAISGADDACPAFSGDARHFVQQTLNGSPAADVDETPYGLGVDAPGVARVAPTGGRRILYATVRTRDDHWIAPEESAVLDGAGGLPIATDGIQATETSPGNFLMTNGIDHDGMPGDADTMRLVARILSTHKPRPTQEVP